MGGILYGINAWLHDDFMLSDCVDGIIFFIMLVWHYGRHIETETHITSPK